MELISSLLNFIVLVLAVPAGFWLAYLCRDELVKGRKWFELLIIISIIGAIGFYLFDFSYAALTFAFIMIASLVSLMKSKDKKWTKNTNS